MIHSVDEALGLPEEELGNEQLTGRVTKPLPRPGALTSGLQDALQGSSGWRQREGQDDLGLSPVQSSHGP